MQINRSILRGSANIGDYVALTKPRVMSLVVFTALGSVEIHREFITAAAR